MQMKKYRISDLFEKVEAQKIQGKANDFPTQKDSAHNIPLLTSTGSNQGFSRYAAKEDCPTILHNVISIASNGDAGATFYQAELELYFTKRQRSERKPGTKVTDIER